MEQKRGVDIEKKTVRVGKIGELSGVAVQVFNSSLKIGEVAAKPTEGYC